MKYDITNHVKEQIISTLCYNHRRQFEGCITFTEIEDEYDGSTTRVELNPSVFEDADDAAKDLLAERIDTLASDLHMENRAENKKQLCLTG